MDVLLALLRDRATLTGGTLRCAVIPNLKRSVGTVTLESGDKVPYSRELVCRVASAPAAGAAITAGGRSGVVSAVVVYDTRGPWMRHARVYLTARQDITGPLPDTVVIYPSVTSEDEYHTIVRRPGVTGVSVPGRLEQTASSESEADGQRRAQTWTLTTDGDLLAAGADAYAAITNGGHVYAMVGDPVRHADATGGTWSTATLRRTGDGSA